MVTPDLSANLFSFKAFRPLRMESNVCFISMTSVEFFFSPFQNNCFSGADSILGAKITSNHYSPLKVNVLWVKNTLEANEQIAWPGSGKREGCHYIQLHVRSRNGLPSWWFCSWLFIKSHWMCSFTKYKGFHKQQTDGETTQMICCFLPCLKPGQTVS